MVEYEAIFTQLSCFAPNLIANEEHKEFHFQDSLNPFFKDRLSFLKLETYLEMVDNTFIVERSSKEFNNIGSNNVQEIDLIMHKAIKLKKKIQLVRE